MQEELKKWADGWVFGDLIKLVHKKIEKEGYEKTIQYLKENIGADGWFL